jgi:hypothetical protein
MGIGGTNTSVKSAPPTRKPTNDKEKAGALELDTQV